MNPGIVVGDNPIVFPTSSMPWNSVNGKRRIAGISSFGFSGTNGHMILSEYVSDDNAEERPMDNHILFLSAKDEEKLVEKIKSYITRFGGTVDEAIEEWGKRRFAYEISHMNEGYYYFIKFDGKNSTPRELEDSVRIMENVVRFLIVKQ